MPTIKSSKALHTAGSAQSERFIEAARQLGTDDDPERFREVVRKLAKAPVARNEPSKAKKKPKA